MAPATTHYLFHNNSIFIQAEKMRYHKINKKLDYVLISFGTSHKEYEKELGIKLKYIKSFTYNDAIYNLFKVKK